MNNQMTGVEVFGFSNQLCTAKGRAINQQVSGWEETLTDSPKQIYQLWEQYVLPRDYKLKTQIAGFPSGMRGDIAMSLSWALSPEMEM